MRLWTASGEVQLTDEEQSAIWNEAVMAAATVLIQDFEALAQAERASR